MLLEMCTTMNCPNCDSAMEIFGSAGVYGPEVEVDLCFACHVIWLDLRESLHLAPRGVLDLFQVLHDRRDDARHALKGRLQCPRCDRRLSLAHDIGKAGRFSYYACPAGHGRLTPFSEFLKEKQFVRALSPLEQTRLRAEVKSVQCSSCGAPVDLGRGFQCEHCGSPITVLDADAVEKTLRELSEADAHRSGDPDTKEERARALAAMEALRVPPDGSPRGLLQRRPTLRLSLGADLLSASIAILFND